MENESQEFDAVGLVRENMEDPLSSGQIARVLGISTRQIERLFRQEMGRSPARYYLEIRLDRARHLLVQALQHLLS